MLRGQDRSIRVEEVTICETSPWGGLTFRDADMHRQTGLTAIAIKKPGHEELIYNCSRKRFWGSAETDSVFETESVF